MTTNETKNAMESFLAPKAMKDRITKQASAASISRSALMRIGVESLLLELEACETDEQRRVLLARRPPPF